MLQSIDQTVTGGPLKETEWPFSSLKRAKTSTASAQWIRLRIEEKQGVEFVK